jgi:hypothetical protein
VRRYVFEPTRDGLVFAIDASLRRTNSSFPSLPPASSAALFRFLCDSTQHPLSPAAAKILASFPIFPHYSDKYCRISTDSITYTLDTGGNAPPESHEQVLKTLSALGVDAVAHSPSELKTLTADLKVSPLTATDFFEMVVFPNLRQLPAPILDVIITDLLSSLPTLEHASPGFSKTVAAVPCVPSVGGALCLPSALFDPENEQLCVLLPPDAFPSEHFHHSSSLITLRELGLKVSMTWETILTCAERIANRDDQYVRCASEARRGRAKRGGMWTTERGLLRPSEGRGHRARPFAAERSHRRLLFVRPPPDRPIPCDSASTMPASARPPLPPPPH